MTDQEMDQLLGRVTLWLVAITAMVVGFIK